MQSTEMHGTEEQAKKPARKKIFVSGMIQGRMLGRLATYWVIYHLVLFHSMFLYHYMQYWGETLAGAQSEPFLELYGSFASNHYSIIICAVAVFPIIFWDMMSLTHRVAGPLVRFRTAMNQLAQGETVEKIKLRDGHLLIEFQDAFNAYLDTLESSKGESGKNSLADNATRPDADELAEAILEDAVALQQMTSSSPQAMAPNGVAADS
jgi:hypothetical protein